MGVGTVFLVGAGPGDPELITAKGIRLLKAADVVLYDYLAHPNLLHHCRPTAIVECVGKRKGQHSKQQAHINDVMIRYAKQGNMVLRLKGGDPTVFGRGGEEMAALQAEGIPYEIVPGVTSAIAVPAYAGIPVTHREKSRSVAFVTGTLHDGQSIDALDLPDADTLVCLMGMTHLDALATYLMGRDRFDAHTPAALIHRGTTAQQKTIVGTLATIAALKDQHDVQAPTLLVVGEVVAVRDQLSWWERLPLHGRRVVILRSVHQSQELVHALCALGAEVLQLPVLDFRPLPEGYEALLGELSDATMVVFTSPNGVSHVHQALVQQGKDMRQLFGKQVVAIGPKTGEALSTLGVQPDWLPDKYESEGILSILPDDLSGESILLPTARVARDVLPTHLEARGARVNICRMYETFCPELPQLEILDQDVVVFTSPSTATHFFESALYEQQFIDAVCIGTHTRSRVEHYMTTRVHISDQADTSSLVETILGLV